MTEPSLALQTALRARLIASPAAVELVPAAHIVDGPARPEAFPAIILGGGQTVVEGDHHPAWRLVTAYSDLHAWTAESGLAGAKTIAGVVWSVLDTAALDIDGFEIADKLHIESVRYLRDPNAEIGHAVISVSALMGWKP